MKPWLVEFHLAPRPAATRGSARGRGVSIEWNAQRPLPVDFAQRVAAVGLAPAAGDAASSRAWGHADGNRIEMREVGDSATLVRIAVDARKLDPGFAAGLLGLVKSTDGILVRSDGLMIDGTVGAFSKALRSSPAWAHVDDPTGLLTGREPAGEEDEP